MFKEPVISYRNGRSFNEIIVTANYNIYIWSRVSLLTLVTNLIKRKLDVLVGHLSRLTPIYVYEVM